MLITLSCESLAEQPAVCDRVRMYARARVADLGLVLMGKPDDEAALAEAAFLREKIADIEAMRPLWERVIADRTTNR